MAAKSSSVAALLLVAAVLLVGTCTSPANAAGPGQVDLVNLCEYDAVVYAGGVVTGIVVEAGETLPVDLEFLRTLITPVYIQINGQFYLFKVHLLEGLVETTGVEIRIDIVCNGVCGENVITLQPYLQVIALGQPVGEPTATAPICLDLVVNP